MKGLLLLPALAAFLLALPIAQAEANAPAPTGSPSLSASRSTVVYGDAVVLNGTVPVAKAGEKVMLRAEVLTPTGTRQTSSIAEVRTDTAGAFSFTTAPTAETIYTVTWQPNPASTTEASAVVRVAPRVGLAAVGRVGRSVTFSASATSAIPYAGRLVDVQRRNALGRWILMKRVVLESSTLVTRLTARLPKGLSRVRIVMPPSQVGSGYVTGLSRVVMIRL